MDKSLRPSVIKRVLALAIDFIILGIIGYLSGFVLEEFYVALGKYGTLFGSAVVISYFSFSQSGYGNGQTFGKKFVGIKVTDLQGDYLNLGRSFLRSFIFFFPIMNAEMFSSIGLLIIGMLLVLSIFISIYFTLVNSSRRSLHDILVSSIITFKDVPEFEISEQNDRTNKKLIPIAFIALLLLCLGIYQTFAQNTLTQMLSVKEIIEQKEGVLAVNEVNYNTTTVTHADEPSQTYTSINLRVRIDDESEASNTESRYFDDFYEIIQNELPEASSVDVVSITLHYGYDIGIASKTQSVRRNFE